MRRALPLLGLAACGDNLRPVTSCRATPGYEVAPGSDTPMSAYDQLVLADQPVAFWRMSEPLGAEPDATTNGHDGHYSSPPPFTTMPNGDPAADFNGEELDIPSAAALSIPTTGSLTWEAWVKPDSLERTHALGYVDWLSKCADKTSCEWEARFYDSSNAQDRCDRFSAYVFNPSAGLGAGADWQPTCDLFVDCEWHHVVGEYTVAAQPADCPTSAQYPGSIDIWVDGVEWNQPAHNPTGCMSEFDVVPVASNGSLVVGTVAGGFDGAIGKVAVYARVLDGATIAAHYQAMTGAAASGRCDIACTTP